MTQLLNEIINDSSKWVGYTILGVSAIYALILLTTAFKGKTFDTGDVKLFYWTFFAGLAVFVMDYLTGNYYSATQALSQFRDRIDIVTIYGLVLTILSVIMMAIARMRKRRIDYKPMRSCLRNSVVITLVTLLLKLLLGGQL